MANNKAMPVKSDTFPLIYDCAVELFKHLDIEECVNLAEGPTAKSLTLTLHYDNYTMRSLIKIRRACKELRCLTLNGFKRRNFRGNPFINFGNKQLEVLTLSQCSLGNDVFFFDGYKSLHSLNVYHCLDLNFMAMAICFQNNPGMKSFTCNSQYFPYPNMLLLLPNLERLSLLYHSQRMTLDILSKLPSLRYLTLLCSGDNVNDLLAHLEKSNQLEELALADAEINEQTVVLITSLERLKFLSITSSEIRSLSTFRTMPSNLQKIKLGGYRIDNRTIASVVAQLTHLDDILLSDCELLWNDCILTHQRLKHYWYFSEIH